MRDVSLEIEGEPVYDSACLLIGIPDDGVVSRFASLRNPALPGFSLRALFSWFSIRLCSVY
jgi:hypothetical protein